ncbi:MBL fold metallo-hydrolase [Desulfurobacterium crinifex]
MDSSNALTVKNVKMKFKVLGAFGGKDRERKTTSFLFRDFVIDAGNLFSAVNHSYQLLNLFLTHSHLDHIIDLPLFLDFAFTKMEKSLKVYASSETIDALRKNIFNETIWPDFSKLYLTSGKPAVEFIEIKEFENITVGEFTVTPLPAAHTVKTFGFRVESNGKAIVLSGDTKSNLLLWEIINSDRKIKAVLVDVSFPSRLQRIADVSGHFTPSSLASDLKNLKRNVDIYIYHIKPAYYNEVKKEIEEKLPFVRILEDNMLVEV